MKSPKSKLDPVDLADSVRLALKRLEDADTGYQKEKQCLHKARREYTEAKCLKRRAKKATKKAKASLQVARKDLSALEKRLAKVAASTPFGGDFGKQTHKLSKKRKKIRREQELKARSVAVKSNSAKKKAKQERH